MVLKIFSPKQLGAKIGVFYSKFCQFMQIIDHNIGFQEKRHFSAEHWEKIVKNFDHYFDQCPTYVLDTNIDFIYHFYQS
jgi:hypothetical protein